MRHRQCQGRNADGHRCARRPARGDRYCAYHKRGGPSDPVPLWDEQTDLLAFVNLFEEFRQPSWDAWRAHLARLTPEVREMFAICGRRSGKSRMAALIATFFAQRSYKKAPGERIYVGVFAPDRSRAAATLNYIAGLLESLPSLDAMVEQRMKESIDLTNGVTIEVISASISAPRGRSYCCAIVEEAAFLKDETSANPDEDIVVAVLPGLGQVPGSLLCVISSAYDRRGIIWNAYQRYHSEAPPDVLFIHEATLALNPTYDKRAIDRLRKTKPTDAAAEYDSVFHTDIEGYVSIEALQACVSDGPLEKPFDHRHEYVAFVDPSGGRADEFAYAIGHVEETEDGDQVACIDLVRSRKPPFSPEGVIEEIAKVLKGYGITSVTGDRYGGEFPPDAFARYGISYEPAKQTKSEFYKDALAYINSERVELPGDQALLGQLAGLERRTARGGKDSIDHAPGGHDDLANVVAALACLLLAEDGTGEANVQTDITMAWCSSMVTRRDYEL